MTRSPALVALRDPMIAGVVATVISLIGITTPSMNHDAAATVSAATRSLPELWAVVQSIDAVHGTYYAFMHFIFGAFGYTPVTLRAPSAVAIGVAAAFVVVLARQLGIARYPIVAGLVFAILPRVTWLGIEGRSFAIATLLVTVSTVLLVRATRSASPGWWVGYAGVAIVGCAFFVFTWLAILAHGIAVLVWSRRPDARAGSLLRWAVAAGVVTLAIIPLVVVMVGQRGQVAWIPRPGLTGLLRMVFEQWFQGNLVAIVGWTLILIGLVAWARGPQRSFALPLVLAGLVLPTAAIAAVTFTVVPLYWPRYLAFGTPFVALAMTGGIVALRWRWLQAVALVLFAAVSLQPYLYQRSTVSSDSTDWSQIIEPLAAARDAAVPSGVVFELLGDSTNSRAMQVAYPAAFEGLRDVALDQSALESNTMWGTTLPRADIDLDGLDELFVLSAERAELPGWRVVDTWESERVVLTQLERLP